MKQTEELPKEIMLVIIVVIVVITWVIGSLLVTINQDRKELQFICEDLNFSRLTEDYFMNYSVTKNMFWDSVPIYKIECDYTNYYTVKLDIVKKQIIKECIQFNKWDECIKYKKTIIPKQYIYEVLN